MAGRAWSRHGQGDGMGPHPGRPGSRGRRIERSSECCGAATVAAEWSGAWAKMSMGMSNGSSAGSSSRHSMRTPQGSTSVASTAASIDSSRVPISTMGRYGNGGQNPMWPVAVRAPAATARCSVARTHSSALSGNWKRSNRCCGIPLPGIALACQARMPAFSPLVDGSSAGPRGVVIGSEHSAVDPSDCRGGVFGGESVRGAGDGCCR